jgi:hypothetical protein
MGRLRATAVLNMPEFVEGAGFRATLRRPIVSLAFASMLGQIQWADVYTPDDQIGAMIPICGRKYSGKHQIPLTDTNGDIHECIAEAFTQGHQIFVLIHAVKTLASSSIILPKAS